MRAVPTIELPQPVPNAPESASRTSNREGGDDFATTLQRRHAENDAPVDKKPQSKDDASKPEAEPAKPKADFASEKPAKDEPTTPTNDAAAPVAADEVVPDDEVMAALVAMTLPAVVTPDSAPVGDLDAALVAPVGKTEATANAAPLTTPVATTPVAVLPTTATANQEAADNAAQAPAPLVASTAPVALAPTASTVDATTVASTSAPVTVVNTAPVTAKTGDQPIVAVTTSAKNTDLPSDAALPPVTAASKADNVTTTPSTTTPSLAALPSTQPATMHTVASAIGEKQAKNDQPKDSATIQVKSTGDALPQVNAPAPTPATTPVKPMSETVLAQNQLAQQGNAMEKSVSQQVTKAMIQQLPNGDRMMVVRLTPPELGTVKIEVVERQGVFSARLHAEDDGVRLALERFLPAMRQDLRASDAPIRQLDLSDQAGFHRSFDGDPQQQRQETNNPNQRRERDDLPRFSIDGVVREPLTVPRATPLGARMGSSWVDARA